MLGCDPLPDVTDDMVAASNITASNDFNSMFRSTCDMTPVLRTPFGVLFAGDCLHLMAHIKDATVDTVFADPPFNLGKTYGTAYDDNRAPDAYIVWCKQWLDECVRILKPGGAIFVFNVPRWNMLLGSYLVAHGLDFRHDIVVEMKNGFPIRNRLYPSHYSLLYFTKGPPA